MVSTLQVISSATFLYILYIVQEMTPAHLFLLVRESRKRKCVLRERGSFREDSSTMWAWLAHPIVYRMFAVICSCLRVFVELCPCGLMMMMIVCLLAQGRRREKSAKEQRAYLWSNWWPIARTFVLAYHWNSVVKTFREAIFRLN